jgi:hypothetical protein
MILGIVGSAADKFTPETEKLAREAIIEQIKHSAMITGGEVETVHLVVSGACHMGGVDQWAIEEATKLDIKTQEYPPTILKWDGGNQIGYKQRNIQIAEVSDKVISLVVNEYPPGYDDHKFASCYHCHSNTHIKSGGCWTLKYAKKLDKITQLVIIDASIKSMFD